MGYYTGLGLTVALIRIIHRSKVIEQIIQSAFCFLYTANVPSLDNLDQLGIRALLYTAHRRTIGWAKLAGQEKEFGFGVCMP